jgi:type IV pilus assembly protein PilQ
MRLGHPHRESRIARHTVLRALWAVALWVGVTFVGMTPAATAADEPSGLQRLFDGVRRGAVTPELLNDTLNPFTDDTEDKADGDSNKPQQSAQAQNKAQLVSDGSGGQQKVGRGEELPSPQIQGTLPLSGWDAPGNIQLSNEGGDRISLIVRDASLSSVLALIAQEKNLNIVASNDIDATISITLRNVPLEEALTSILSVANYTWVCRNNIIMITSMADASRLPADVQGKQIQVFQLDYASAVEVANAVTTFLSPIGQVTTSVSDPTNNRRTRELVVVEDLPTSLQRIAAYIHCVDVPPRQVEIEAHVLQVTLKDFNRHGVDFDALFRVAGAAVNIETKGFTTTNPTQAFLATIKGTDLNAVIELLETTTDTKTLGSPKLLVVNDQEANMQVGQQFGYRTSITTETSTQQQIQFLDVGVLLRITPRITRDGRVMLHVRPEVSSGRVDPDGLPQTETTQLETDVMLDDGQGMILGGLIKEIEDVQQSKVPVIGDAWLVGKLFQKSEVTKERVEIIIAIVPRVQPYEPQWNDYEQGQVARAGVELFHGPLCRTDRPFDAILPDGDRVSRPWLPPCSPPEDYRNFCGPNSYFLVTPHPNPEQNLYGPACDAEPEGSFMWQEEEQPQVPVELAPTMPHGQWQHAEVISDQD